MHQTEGAPFEMASEWEATPTVKSHERFNALCLKKRQGKVVETGLANYTYGASLSIAPVQSLFFFLFFKSVALESRGGQVSAKTSPAASHYTILVFKSAGSEENRILETDNLIQPAHQFSLHL